MIPANYNLWHFLTRRSPFCRPSLSALGAGLGIWGVINLLEGYGNDNPGAKSQGMKQLMAGAGVAIVGMVLVPCCPACSPSDRTPLKSSPPPALSGRG